MKEIINPNKTLDESLKNKRSAKKANELFQKILAKNNAKKNPFDETRTQSYPSMTELKPGENVNDPV